MKAKRFTEEQIIGILKQAEAGMKIIDLCRMNGIPITVGIAPPERESF